MAFRIELPKQAIRSELKQPLPDGSTRNPFFDRITELTNFGYRLRARGNKFILQVDDDELINLKDALDWVEQSETLYGRPVEIEGLEGFYRATANALDRDIPEGYLDDLVTQEAVAGRDAIDPVLAEDGTELRPGYPAVPAVEEVKRRPKINELPVSFVFDGFTYGPINSTKVSDFAVLQQITGVRVITANAFTTKQAEYEASLGTGQ